MIYIAFDTIIKNAKLEKIPFTISFFIVDKLEKEKL